jgi:hypothetical protein
LSETSRTALLGRIENRFAGALADDLDLGDGASLFRSAAGGLVVTQGGQTIALDRASIRLLEKIGARLDR